MSGFSDPNYYSSGWQATTPRSLGPKPSGLPTFPHPVLFQRTFLSPLLDSNQRVLADHAYKASAIDHYAKGALCRVGEIRTLGVTMTLGSKPRPLPNYGPTTLFTIF